MGILGRLKKTDKKKDATTEQDVKVDKKEKKTESKKEAKKTDVKKDAKKASNKKTSLQSTHVLLSPIVTEKATFTGTYQFKVAPNATKNEVSKAFETLYGKSPLKVNMMNVSGKEVRSGRIKGKRSDWKKAIVYLTKGESVDIFVE